MTVQKLWGEELAWIENDDLRQKTTRVWELALERSVLSADDLNRIPFTLKAGPDMKVSFMAHKRAVVHVAKESALKMQQFFTDDLPIDLDTVIAGAILCDVGKLLEYELDENGESFQGNYGKYVRHPFSGVSIAEECGIPPEVTHIIAAHAAEGNLIQRTTEAYIVHHADFMTFLPFKERLEI